VVSAIRSEKRGSSSDNYLLSLSLNRTVVRVVSGFIIPIITETATVERRA
jgi:hypothetical protein